MCKLFGFPLNQDENKKEKLTFLFHKQFSADSVAPLQDLCCLFPFYMECLETTLSEILRKFMKNKCYGNLLS